MKMFGLWVCVLLLSCGTAVQQSSPPVGRQPSVAGETDYVGELQPGYSAEEVAQALGVQVVETLQVGERRFVRLRSEAGAKTPIGSLADAGDMRASGASGRAFLPQGLLSLEHNYRLSFPEDEASQLSEGGRGAGTPNDVLFSQQYAPQLTDLPQAWALRKGKGVRVAVIDSGVNTRHEDFQRTTFEQGWDYIFNSSYASTDNYDWNGHGTHVAGIIAADLGNGRGITGVAPEVTIIPYRVLDANGWGTMVNVASAIAAAASRRVDIINLSLGSSHYSTVVAVAVQQAVSAGVLVVAAAGNDGIAVPSYPAAYPGVVAVASSDRHDQLSYYSSRGNFVDITAPGQDILSLDAHDNRGYLVLSGTSMAAPFVSGALALLREQYPSAQAGQLADLLEQTAAPAGAPGYDPLYGWGLVRPYRALTDSLPPVKAQSRWLVKVFNQGRIVSSPTAVNIYSSHRDRLFSLYSHNGQVSLDLPYGSYYYSVNYFGYGSGLQPLELTQPRQETAFHFDLDLFTISTSEVYRGMPLDTVVEVYAHSLDPYNMVGSNDDEGTSLYSSLTVARPRGEKLLVRVKSYDGRGGDYLLCLARGEKSTGSSAAGSPRLVEPSSGPIAVQTGTSYRDSLTPDQPQRDFVLEEIG